MITLLMLPFLLARIVVTAHLKLLSLISLFPASVKNGAKVSATIRTSVHEDGKHNVPIYTYTAHVSINSVNQDTGLQSKAFEMSSGLKCHPRVPDTLNCRFDNTDMKFYQQGLADLGEDSIEAWDMSEEPFAVQFDKKGVSDLIVDRSMPPWVIGGLRSIINQLNIGLDLRQINDGTFVTTERSYLGQCETLVRINRLLDGSENVWNDNAYEIIFMPGFRKDSGEVVEIVKERNLEKCSDDIDPLFGRKGASSTAYGNIPTRMVSSASRITISDTNYTSFTANEILATRWNTGENMRLYEKITLKLDSVKTGGFAHSSNDWSTFKKGSSDGWVEQSLPEKMEIA